MMGAYVHDPDGIEGRPGTTEGMNLLPVETELKAPKVTTLTKFFRQDAHGQGYEIHMGQTHRKGGVPLFRVESRNNAPTSDEDGCISGDLNSMGTYIHGIFDNPAIMNFWLCHIGLDGISISTLEGIEARNKEYHLLVEHFEKHIDVESIIKLIK